MKVDGQLPTEIHCVQSADTIGDSVTVCVSEKPSAGAIWTIALFVRLDSGRYVVAEFQTQPANSIKYFNRVVAKACIPGAIGWSVSVTCDEAPGDADICVHSSKEGGAAFFELINMPPAPP